MVLLTLVSTKPLDYLYILLGADIFQYIAEETNTYAQQQGATQFHVNANEIAAFTGINIAMGVVNLPSIHDY